MSSYFIKGEEFNISKFNTIVLFSSGICDLNCKYCFIDKNPALTDIDKLLDKSFKTNYYIDTITKWLPDRHQLKTIELWGGEPTLFLSRIYPLLTQIINYYSEFNEIFFSTNFAGNNWSEKIISLIQELGKYSYRKFTIRIQLSCDGPQYINDSGRGIGTTDKCLNNFNDLLSKISYQIPANITLLFGIKQTLSIQTIQQLQDYNAVYNYYKFFEENFAIPFYNLNLKNSELYPGIPNLAVPAPFTQQNGIEFANFCKLCKELQNNNKKNHLFKYINDFIPYTGVNKNQNYSIISQPGCGSGVSQICLLPNDLYSICHLGFVELVEKYKAYNLNSIQSTDKIINLNHFLQDTQFKTCLSETEYKDFINHMQRSDNSLSTSRHMSILNNITALAYAGQIDEKYKSLKEAHIATCYITKIMSFCINDGLNIAGSLTLQPIGIYKEILNGAFDIIKEELDKTNEEL